MQTFLKVPGIITNIIQVQNIHIVVQWKIDIHDNRKNSNVKLKDFSKCDYSQNWNKIWCNFSIQINSEQFKTRTFRLRYLQDFLSLTNRNEISAIFYSAFPAQIVVVSIFYTSWNVLILKSKIHAHTWALSAQLISKNLFFDKALIICQYSVSSYRNNFVGVAAISKNNAIYCLKIRRKFQTPQ